MTLALGQRELLVLNHTPFYDVTCACGLHRTVQLAPQVCIRCGGYNLTIVPAQGQYATT
jgi:hypothetical protein